uniref:Protein phosphatase 1F n=1 Tax=Latimeria chalumnae TaxID=7897 RepID=H3B1C6_LATCH
ATRNEMEDLVKNPEAARRFLDSFLKEFPSSLGPDDPLPAKPQSSILTQEEAEGEMAELGLRVLQERDVPPLLAASLTHAAISEVLQTNLSAFYKKLETEQETPVDPCDASAPLSVLEAKELQRLFINQLQQLCCSWQKQLPSLKAAERYLHTSVHAIRNTRRKMEDRHVILRHFNQLFGLTDEMDRAYFAVFDGHGGVDAAIYSATHVHVNVACHEAIISDPAKALKASFKRTDDMFLHKAERERLRSGTTCVAALIAGNSLHVAWLGDSQVVMVREGETVLLMDPHKPEREDEKERIEALGGCVAYMGCWRVNGTLAVSRAIGDVDQKPYVSGEADGASFALTGTEDYIILACDGFFDAIKPGEVVDLVLELLCQAQGDGSRVAEGLVAAARQGGSNDNITVLLVYFRDPRDIMADSAK